MNNKLSIKLKKRTQPETLCWLIILVPFLFGALLDLAHLPAAMKYVIDIFWVLLVGYLVVNVVSKKAVMIKESKTLYIWVLSFLLFTLAVYIFNYQSVLYYLWGIRNNFRFYVAFFAFIIFLNKENVVDFWRLMDVLFWINAIVCFVQYFVFGINQDNLGGIFGTTVGCNGYLNIFFVITITKTVIAYINKNEKLWLCILKIGLVLLICAYAELKFFYVEFVVIVILAVIITDFSWRKLLVTVGGIIGVVLSTQLLGQLFPQFADIFTIEAMFESAYEGGYSSEVSINRLNSIPVISEKFLTTLPKQIFGLGLGNCDTASYSVVNTPFYIQNSYLRYNWFSTAFTFLETGYIGLIFFFGFFVAIAILVLKLLKNLKEDKIYYQTSAVVAICCLMIGVYNASLRIESGYMIYFVLAMPFILQKSKLKQK